MLKIALTYLFAKHFILKVLVESSSIIVNGLGYKNNPIKTNKITKAVGFKDVFTRI